MLKLKKIYFTISSFLISPILLSSIIACNNTSSKMTVVREFEKPIIREDSYEKLLNKFNNNQFKSIFKNDISEVEFEIEMKKNLKEELIIDSESLIYKELVRLNKINEFQSQYIDESYNSLISEIKNEIKIGQKHWIGVFKSHSWETVGRKLQALSLNLLAVADIALQVGPAIYLFIKNGDTQPLIDALSSFDGSLTDFSKLLFIKGLENLRNWKLKTNCKTIFYVWGQKL